MRALTNIAVAVILSCFSFCKVAHADGPFGVTKGIDVSELASCKPTSKSGYYKCENLPRMHPDFEYYIVQAWKDIGVCWVKGVGKDISSNGYGTSIRSAVDEIKEQLSEIYGSSKKSDFLLPKSIWNDPSYWMMGLAKKDRIYSYEWSQKNKSKMKDGIKTVYLAAVASNNDSGYVIVEFSFDNSDACETAEKKAKVSAF